MKKLYVLFYIILIFIYGCSNTDIETVINKEKIKIIPSVNTVSSSETLFEKIEDTSHNKKMALENALKIIETGEGLEIPDKYGNTPLLFAIKKIEFLGEDKVVAALIKKGVKINIEDRNGKTPLILALSKLGYNGVEKIVELMVEYGADVNKPDRNGKYPLALAIEKENYDIAVNYSPPTLLTLS